MGYTVFKNVKRGKHVTIWSGAVVGRRPMGTGIIVNEPVAFGPTIIGDGTVIGANAVIYQGVQLGNNVLIGDGACIRENTVIGDDTIIGSNCTIQNGATIGSRVRIVDLSHITYDCEIGDDTFISVGVYTMNDNWDGGPVVGPKIGKRVNVGGGAMFLPGVIVGDDAIIAAGAVVTKDVAPGTKVFGIPAKTRAQAVSYNYDHFFEFDGWPPPKPMPEE